MYGIGKGVEIVRKMQGHTQASLAEISKIDQSRISLIENGYIVPNNTTVDKIADALDVSPVLLVWFSITRDEAPEEKKPVFDVLKPSLDEMIRKIFDPKEKLNK